MTLKSQIIIVLLFCLQINAGQTIAFTQLTASGVTEGEARSLTDGLRAEMARSKLVKNGFYQIMERGQMDAILKEQGFQQAGVCDEATCAVEMGKLLAVKYMLLGNIGKVGKTYTMNVRMVDVQSGKIVKDIIEYHTGPADELLTKITPVVAEKIIGTYTEKKNMDWVWWTAGGVAVVAAAGTTAYFLMQPKNTSNTMNVEATW